MRAGRTGKMKGHPLLSILWPPPGRTWGKSTGDHGWAPSASASVPTSKDETWPTQLWGLCYKDDKGAPLVLLAVTVCKPLGRVWLLETETLRL